MKTFPDDKERNQVLIDNGQVLGKWGDPELDIGHAVVFLAGPDSTMITGSTLRSTAARRCCSPDPSITSVVKSVLSFRGPCGPRRRIG